MNTDELGEGAADENNSSLNKKLDPGVKIVMSICLLWLGREWVEIKNDLGIKLS